MKVSFWFAVCCSSTLSLKLRLSTVLFRQPSETNTEERREERKGERERKTGRRERKTKKTARQFEAQRQRKCRCIRGERGRGREREGERVSETGAHEVSSLERLNTERESERERGRERRVKGRELEASYALVITLPPFIKSPAQHTHTQKFRLQAL